jgi:hypothetical protein
VARGLNDHRQRRNGSLTDRSGIGTLVEVK